MTEEDGLPESRRRLAMGCILLGVVLGNLDGAIANIALPTIGRELSASDSATVWIVNSYQLSVAICLLPIAALGEIFTLKRVYAFGIGLFGLASLGCALSPNLTVLVGARLIQGAGGACLAALGPALIRAIYPRRIIASGFALIALAVAISAAVGPTIAALILSVATWPWLFLVNIPICIIALPLFLAIAPRGSSRRRPFDFAGTALSAVALGLIVIGVDALGGQGIGVAVGEIVAGLFCSVLLVWLQSRRQAPLLPLDLMRVPVFALSAGASVCSYAAQILSYVSLPFLFQSTLGRSPLATGLLMTPWPLLVAVAAPISGRLLSRYRPSILASLGLVALAIGLFLLAALPDRPADWDIAWRMGLCGIGFGFFQTPNNMVLMTSGPADRSGAASGMVALARTLGWSLGSALVALIFALHPTRGTVVCLAAGAIFAVSGAAISGARLISRQKPS